MSIHPVADSTTRRRIAAAAFNLEDRSSERVSTCVSASLSTSSACARARVCNSPTLRLWRETAVEALWAYSFSFSSPSFEVIFVVDVVVVVVKNVDFSSHASHTGGRGSGEYITSRTSDQIRPVRWPW